ncbi:MAG TPA: hypothetical protein PK927_03315, partial [Smithellaceae bacterium]|nr:hypothetical protein [Smithellaceae bacterium]
KTLCDGNDRPGHPKGIGSLLNPKARKIIDTTFITVLKKKEATNRLEGSQPLDFTGGSGQN